MLFVAPDAGKMQNSQMTPCFDGTIKSQEHRSFLKQPFAAVVTALLTTINTILIQSEGVEMKRILAALPRQTFGPC